MTYSLLYKSPRPVGRESDSLFTPRVKLIVFLVEVRLYALLLEIVQLLLVLLGQEELCGQTGHHV